MLFLLIFERIYKISSYLLSFSSLAYGIQGNLSGLCANQGVLRANGPGLRANGPSLRANRGLPRANRSPCLSASLFSQSLKSFPFSVARQPKIKLPSDIKNGFITRTDDEAIFLS
ncbi:hypothetical protein A374_15459 [Fictibacillus macauensis ZFHKF-1]|uniref:Uncharacterized protein n=1 Tax=Fictibacillus macauensis ZFHKF-1 TaxID=1196324 RepID=I8AG81_9BACL|nr:hypothetical protein A374_15459 [Fictibacillus macauensis ZFHKF-1]